MYHYKSHILRSQRNVDFWHLTHLGLTLSFNSRGPEHESQLITMQGCYDVCNLNNKIITLIVTIWPGTKLLNLSGATGLF